MESFLNRYRNITVLLLVIFAQLLLLAAQVKNDQDVRVIRVWAVSAVTPLARVIEGLRGGGSGFVHNYILLHDTNEANRRLQSDVDRLKMENIFLKNELNTADRAKALLVFQAHTPSKTVAATIIAMGAGSNSKLLFVDRGTESGVMRGMAVVTPDGIVGKVIASYPFTSEVQLITDADFGAGVMSLKSQAHGTLKGQGTPLCKVDYVAFDEKIEAGDWFYTSGDDRIFPRGFPVGVVKSVVAAQPFKEIYVEPTGLQRGLEDVLIVIQAVHQDLPEQPPTTQPVYIAPAPPPTGVVQQTEGQPPPAAPAPATGGTEADKLRSQYKVIGEAQKHVFGVGEPGSKPPDFNMKVPQGGLVAPPLPQGVGAPPKSGAAPQTKPAGTPQTGAPAVAPGQGAPQTRPAPDSPPKTADPSQTKSVAAPQGRAPPAAVPNQVPAQGKSGPGSPPKSNVTSPTGGPAGSTPGQAPQGTAGSGSPPKSNVTSPTGGPATGSPGPVPPQGTGGSPPPKSGTSQTGGPAAPPNQAPAQQKSGAAPPSKSGATSPTGGPTAAPNQPSPQGKSGTASPPKSGATGGPVTVTPSQAPEQGKSGPGSPSKSGTTPQGQPATPGQAPNKPPAAPPKAPGGDVGRPPDAGRSANQASGPGPGGASR